VLESQPSASVAPVGGASAAELAVATSRANVETPATSCVAPLSETQRADAMEAFEIFDLNGNGAIDTHELATALKSVGLNPSAAEVTTMIQQADNDGNGALNLEEFLAMVADQASSGTGRQLVARRSAPSERRHAAAAAGGTSNPLFKPSDGGSSDNTTQVLSIEIIFSEIDTDRSGQLEIEEFTSWWRANGGDPSQVLLFEQYFDLMGAEDGIAGVSLLEFKKVIGAVATNDWLEKYSAEHRRPYWVNERTNESTWLDPSGPDQVGRYVQEWLERVGMMRLIRLEV
jgi:calmodulin